MTNVHSYTLINYFDVWKDLDEGWIVNDQCVECDDLNITDDAAPKEICEYLKKQGYLSTSDMRRLEVVDWGDNIEIYQRQDHVPLFGLMMNY